MKKIILFTLCLASFTFIRSQIGINTETPAALLHIDTNKDNDAGGAHTDDIVVTSEGNIGIGTINPDAKVDVRGKFKYVDGNQKSNYVLLSDAHGNARWGEEPDPFYVKGVLTPMANISNQYRLIGPNITLEPGNWMISFVGTYYINNASTSSTNIFWVLSTSNTSLASVGQSVSNPSANGGHATVYATYLVFPKVKTTYYMWAKGTNLPNGVEIGYSGEENMWAIAIGDKAN